MGIPLIKIFHPQYVYDLDKRNEFNRTKETLMFFYEEEIKIEYLIYSDIDVPFDLKDYSLTCIFYQYNTENIIQELTNEDGGGITILNEPEGYIQIKPIEPLERGSHHYILYIQSIPEDDEDTPVLHVLDRNYITIKGKSIGGW